MIIHSVSGSISACQEKRIPTKTKLIIIYIILFQCIIYKIDYLYESRDVSEPKIGCIKKMNIPSDIGRTGHA